MRFAPRARWRRTGIMHRAIAGIVLLAVSPLLALAGCTGDDTSPAVATLDASVPDTSAPVPIGDAGAPNGALACTPGLLANPTFCDGSTCITAQEALAPDDDFVCADPHRVGASSATCAEGTVVGLGGELAGVE